MTNLPMWRDDATSSSSSNTLSAQQRQRTRLLVILWTALSAMTVMVILGMESHVLQTRTFSGRLFLEENLRGSPAIGLPESDEDDQYYEWNVVSKTAPTNPSVTLLLAESLFGSPAIGAKPWQDDDDDDEQGDYDDDDSISSSVDEAGNEQVSENKKEGEPSILEGMLQVWNGNYRVEDQDSSDSSSSDEGYYDTHEDDLIDSTGTAPEMALAQA